MLCSISAFLQPAAFRPRPAWFQNSHVEAVAACKEQLSRHLTVSKTYGWPCTPKSSITKSICIDFTGKKVIYCNLSRSFGIGKIELFCLKDLLKIEENLSDSDFRKWFYSNTLVSNRHFGTTLKKQIYFDSRLNTITLMIDTAICHYL